MVFNRAVAILSLASALIGLFECSTRAEERPLGAPANAATAQERLLMEQIDQLASTKQFAEAKTNLERLVDNSQGRLVESGPMQRAGTLAVQVHVPIHRWAHQRLFSWARATQGAGEGAVKPSDSAAEALASARERHDAVELQKLVDRHILSTDALSARLFLCDLYLDRGWTAAARQALEAPGISLRVPYAIALSKPEDQPRGNADPSAPTNEPSELWSASQCLPWPTAWSQLSAHPQRKTLLTQSIASLHATEAMSRETLTVELLRRMLQISVWDCTDKEFEDSTAWAQAVIELLPASSADAARQSIADANQWRAQSNDVLRQSNHAWSTFGSDNARTGSSQGRVEMTNWPKWSQQLLRVTGASDRNPASKPPVAENTLSLLPYYPLVHKDRIYVHELTRIVAYNLSDGKPWPPSDPSMPLFDSGLTGANYLPFGYAIIGSPRGTLTIADDVLYARMGPPVTGWFGKVPSNANESMSYLVALDLNRQGSMRPGFPVRLPADDFPSSEFDGAPIVIGNQLCACISTRDNVSLRRWIMAIDRETGAMLWRSPTIASGTVSGSEQASLVSHQLLTSRGGRLYVNTNLGAIACIDQGNGQIQWLTRYRRSAASVDQAYPKPDRYRYRDLSPCMLVGTQLICAPQDCPEVFSLDATTGQLLWSTDAEQADDATQLLGVHKNNLIIAGDRVFWLDTNTGRTLAAFPPAPTSDASSALPAPRGYGRGVVSADRVYWPTQQEIFVFDADQSSGSMPSAPRIRERFRLDTRGAEGGNLLLLDQGVVIAGANRLFVFFERPAQR